MLVDFVLVLHGSGCGWYGLLYTHVPVELLITWDLRLTKRYFIIAGKYLVEKNGTVDRITETDGVSDGN